MTGHAPTGIPPRNQRTRRDQLQNMLNLQRRLDSIKACNCPDDCRGLGRVPLPGNGHQTSGGSTADTSNSQNRPSSNNNEPSSSNNNEPCSSNNQPCSSDGPNSTPNNPPSSSNDQGSSGQDDTRNTFLGNRLRTGDTSDLFTRIPTPLEDDSLWDENDGSNDGATS